MKRIASNKLLFEHVPWKVLPIKSKVNLETSLTCGQAFRWRFFEEKSFIGVFHHRLWQVKLEEENFKYKVLACLHRDRTLESKKAKCSCHLSEESIVLDYFRLKEDIDKLKQIWCEKDPNVREALKETGNLIVFRQDPVENLFTFLCTQNNNVTRIVGMVENMCQLFGEKIIEIENTDGEIKTFYDFPTLERLQEDDVPEKLREFKFGYRAPYVQKCAQMLVSLGGIEYLEDLRDNQPYEEVFKKLQQLHGIGRKVADCICLMSLDKLEAVPIDTHIKQIAVNNYHFQTKTKHLGVKSYNDIGNFFREKWGDTAGWAQTILFARKLPQNAHLYQL